MRAPSRTLGLVLLAGLAALPLTAQSGPASPMSTPTFPLAEAALSAVGGPLWPGVGAANVADAPIAFQSSERNRGKGALWGAGLGLVGGGLLAGLTVSSDEEGGDAFGEGLGEAAISRSTSHPGFGRTAPAWV